MNLPQKLSKAAPASMLNRIILALVLLTAYGIFMYTDMTNTIDNSIVFIRAARHGQILQFYELSVQQAQTSYSANYNLIIYVIFALWLLPCYGISKLLGKEFLTWSIGMLWAKTLVILVTLAIAYLIYKILSNCLKNEEENTFSYLAPLIFLSSMSVYYAVFITAQLDCFAVFFMLIGLWGYLKNNRTLFYIGFLIAAPCKMFSLLITLPLILLRQKNILKAGCLWIFTACPLFVERILFHNSAVYKYALQAQGSAAVKQILESNVVIGRPIILFVACYIVLILFCFMTERKDNSLAIFICAFVYSTFCAFVSINSYWIFLFIPFLTINMFVNSRYLGVNILLETVCSLCYVLGTALGGTWIFRDENLTSRLLLNYVIDPSTRDSLKYGTLYNLFAKANLTMYDTLFSTVFVISLILILLLSLPVSYNNIALTDTIAVNHKIPDWLIGIRIAFLAVLCCLLLYAGNRRINPVFYSNLDNENKIQYADLTSRSEDNIISQEISFDHEIYLDELQLKFHNLNTWRTNASTVTVEIWNKSENTCLFRHILGGYTIQENALTPIALKNTHVTPGILYEIRLSGTSGIAFNENIEYICPYVTTEADPRLAYIQINGESQPRNLYFSIR